MTDFSGEVILWSNAGAVLPVSVQLSNGAWTDSVTPYEAGSGIHLGTSGDGKSGTSNSFNVTGQGSGMGKLTGEVWDNTGKRHPNANVSLISNDKSTTYPQTTDDQGKYTYNVSSGSYSLIAELNGKSSDPIKLFVPDNRTSLSTPPIIIPLGIEEVHNPVILVPGILGSRSKGIVYPHLPAKYPSRNDINKFTMVGTPNQGSEKITTCGKVETLIGLIKEIFLIFILRLRKNYMWI